MKWARAGAIVMALLSLVFATFWASMRFAPAYVERTARPHIVELLKAEAERRYPPLKKLDTFSGYAESLRAELSGTRQRLASREPEAFARWFSAILCQRECVELEGMLAEFERAWLRASLQSIGLAMDRIEDWARGRYGECVAELLRDLSIVCGTNAVLLALSAAALWIGGLNRLTLSLAAVLFASSLLGSYFYFFEQNWFLTLVYSSYVGKAYIVGVCVIGASLSDCVFNRGRVLGSIALARGP